MGAINGILMGVYAVVYIVPSEPLIYMYHFLTDQPLAQAG